MSETTESIFGDVIYSYSRAQAIEDGTLVDLCQGEWAELVKQAGFKFPIACTSEVFHDCIGLTEAAKKAGNDEKGRLWDVLMMLKFAIRASRSTDRIEFTVGVVRERVRPTPTKLIAVCGPGDDMAPVITIMYPHES